MGGCEMSSSTAKTLYVSDLDGTLLGADSRLSSHTETMLNQAIEDGAHFTIATARTPATISSLLAGVNMRLPAIAVTGAVRWDFHTGLYSHEKLISADIAEEMLRTYKEFKLPVFVYTLCGEVIEVRHFGEMSELEHQFIEQRCATPYKRFVKEDSFTSLIEAARSGALLFYSMRPTEQVEPVYHHFQSLAGLSPVFYHDIFGPSTALLEVFSHTASKASAIQSLACEIGAERIVVFGDNVNDLPMMRIADRSVAVANAIDAVRKEADEVIEANTTDSVAKWILHDLASGVTQ